MKRGWISLTSVFANLMSVCSLKPRPTMHLEVRCLRKVVRQPHKGSGVHGCSPFCARDLETTDRSKCGECVEVTPDGDVVNLAENGLRLSRPATLQCGQGSVGTCDNSCSDRRALQTLWDSDRLTSPTLTRTELWPLNTRRVHAHTD